VRQHNALKVAVRVHLHGGDVPPTSDGHPLDLLPLPEPIDPRDSVATRTFKFARNGGQWTSADWTGPARRVSAALVLLAVTAVTVLGVVPEAGGPEEPLDLTPPVPPEARTR
jgi:hypothetical protein